MYRLYSNKTGKVVLILLILSAIAFAIDFWAGLILSGGVLAVITVVLHIHNFHKVFLGFLGMILIGYAFGGKGFAYLGVYPVFVGEIALSLGLITILIYFFTNKNSLASLPLKVSLGFLIGLGIVRLAYDFPQYKILSLRDGVVWGYSFFAIAIFLALREWKDILNISVWFARWAPYFLIVTPFIFLIFRLKYQILPRWPWGAGEGVPVLNPKGGDIAVHLSGIVVFLLIGLYRQRRGRLSLKNWMMWILWFISFVLVGTTGRAAFLTMSFSLLVIGFFRSFRQWLKVFYIIGILLISMEAFDISFDLGVGRKISTEQIYKNAVSVFSETHYKNLEGTKQWRLRWWQTIIDYTFLGKYFWTGKGFGVNLADDDGFQVTADHSLRSPHNSHLTFLARMGVPGFVVWIVLQISFALQLLRLYQKAKKYGFSILENLNLWVFIYWAAFMVNGAFDVFLEGPQGGIWFWSVFGYGLALINYQNRLYRSR